jgi:Putative Ig domain
MASGNQLMVRRLGNQMEAWVYQAGTWSLKLTATDATLIGGKIGALVRGTNTRLDDFGAGAPGTFPPPSTPPPPPYPPSALLDNFNRSDEDPLSQAGQWAPNDPRGSCCTDVLRVNSNQAMVRSSGNNVSYRTQNYSSDIEVFATITSKPGDGGAAALVFNLQQEGSSGWDGYYLTWDALSGTDRLRFEKIVNNGVPGTDLASMNLEMASGNKLMVRRIGSEMRAYVNQGSGWTLRLTATDSTLIGGKIGALLRDSNGRLDDFGGGFPVGSEPPPPVEITTTTLPGGQANVAYIATLQATGGTPPYTWARTSGSLPAGLTLSSTGEISGTPTSAGTSSFTVRATDATAQTDTQALSITIGNDPNEPNPPLLDDFNNRGNENPVSQGGNWDPVGIHGGSGARLSSNRLQSFAQPGLSFRKTLYHGTMEASARITSTPSTSDWLSVFISLQLAGTSAWSGYELRATNVSGTDRWEIRRVQSGQPTVIGTTNFNIASGTMLLRRNGDHVEFWWRPSNGSWAKRLTVVDTTFTAGQIGVGGYRSGALDDFGGGGDTTDSLLARYTPELRFHGDETYSPDRARIATDLHFPDHSTYLMRDVQNGAPLVRAAADHSLEYDDLSLEYLGTDALAGEYLDQPGEGISGAAADYARWIGPRPNDRHVAYGRMKIHPTGVKYLQYWMYYYYNPKEVDIPTHPGEHEGDWEWVQVQLSSTNVPISLAVSQHGGGESCPWPSGVQLSAGRPIVYVAHESHANYLWAGDHEVDIGFTDFTSDSGIHRVPAVVNVTNAPAWLLWDGFWGASFGAGKSPGTPGVQRPWDDPWGWEDDTHACTRTYGRKGAAETPTTARDERPPLPSRVTARRVTSSKYGRALRVSYCFSSLSRNAYRRPWRLHLTLDNTRDKRPPLSVPWTVSRRCASVIHPAAGIRRPYVLRYSVESRRGTRSKHAQISIR